MYIVWTKELEIGDPVVDSEHRYLAELINNLHDQFEAGKEDLELAKMFSHLANYVRVHFENEEALMEAIQFPSLEEHRIKHKNLVDQALELSEQYMEGENNITVETLEFLKKWAVDHIAGTDMQIKAFLKGKRPPTLVTTPAFATHSGPEFKVCSLCGKKWHTYDDLVNDKDKELKGVQPDITNHLYNLILFNCSCGTTLGLFIKQFITQADIPFEIEEHSGDEYRPEHCLKKNQQDKPCLGKCACRYTRQILEVLE